MGHRRFLGGAASSSMNPAVTIFGFALSAMFMLVICGRLLCARMRQSRALRAFQSGAGLLVERSLRGMEPSVVASYPTLKYKQQLFTSPEDNICTICLAEYKEKEVLLVLPICGHLFHATCINLWLRQHSTCPVCRISLRGVPEWERISCPLIGFSARPRLFSGALPVFEQISESQGPPAENLRHGPREFVSVDCSTDAVSRGNGGEELRGPSSALGGQTCRMESPCTGQSEDRQRLTEVEQNLPSDASGHGESVVSLPETPDKRGSKNWESNSSSQVTKIVEIEEIQHLE